jgi:hypothetical protein
MTQTWGMGIQSGVLSVDAAKKIWMTLVRPILEYGAEVWGEQKWEEAEKLQRDMGKRILGLKESTNNEVVLGELGWWKMKTRRDMIRLRYWRKLLNMGKERLPRIVYEGELRKGGKNWVSHTEDLLRELKLEEYWEKQEVKESEREWNVMLRIKLHTREEREWREKVEAMDKLRTYTTIKTKLISEEYLKMEDEEGRKQMARIRSGTNDLRIETGRHEGLERNARKCWFGCDETEDEEHFLMKCKMYADLRRETIKSIGTEIFQKRGREIMLGKGNKEEIKQAFKYIKMASARRRRILGYKEK